MWLCCFSWLIVYGGNSICYLYIWWFFIYYGVVKVIFYLVYVICYCKSLLSGWCCVICVIWFFLNFFFCGGYDFWILCCCLDIFNFLVLLCDSDFDFCLGFRLFMVFGYFMWNIFWDGFGCGVMFVFYLLLYFWSLVCYNMYV